MPFRGGWNQREKQKGQLDVIPLRQVLAQQCLKSCLLEVLVRGQRFG